MYKLCALIMTVLASAAEAGTLSFYHGEKEVKQVTVSEMQKVGLQKAEVYNLHRKYSKVYQGQDFFVLLDSVYGKQWREASSIRFKALDGFVQTASVKKMLEASKSHSGFIAVADKEKGGFSTFDKNGKVVNPGPYYLVWTKFDGRSVANYNDALKWPYQLKSIHLLK